MAHTARCLIVFLCILGILAVTPAGAEDKDFSVKPWDKGSIAVGSFVAGTDSSLRLGVTGIGVTIDVEDALGLESTTTVLRTDAFWRYADNLKHRLEFTWFALRRDGQNTIGRNIPVGGGSVIPIGTTVESTFDFDLYKLGYSYSFFQDNRMDIAAGFGLFIAPINFEINASGFVTNYAAESITAPLPVLTLRGDFAITPKLFLKNQVEAFYLEYANYRGAIYDYRLNLEYNWFKHVGVGLGVETFNLNLEAEGSDYPGVDFVGEIGFRYTGAMLYMKFYF